MVLVKFTCPYEEIVSELGPTVSEEDLNLNLRRLNPVIKAASKMIVIPCPGDRWVVG